MQCGNAYQEDDVYDERQLNYWDRVQMITMNTSREGVREGGSEGVREGVSFDKSNLSLAAWIGAKQLRSPGAELYRNRSINYLGAVMAVPASVQDR